jgi:serine phosphatase RsbU (regulator of sigma subunit)
VSDEQNEAALTWLLERARDADPVGLAGLIRCSARRTGLGEVTAYVADVQQDYLVPLPDNGAPHYQAPPERVAVDGTLAGWAYRTESIRISQGQELITLWVPLVDGIERIGVLQVVTPGLDAIRIDRARALASLVALIVASKNLFSDSIIRATRERPMSLPAEMVWAFLPPLTIGTSQMTSTAVLEPAYEVGGDAFDHSLVDGTLHVTVADAMGHDLASGLQAAVALAGCRSERRRGGGLPQIARAVDEALAHWLPGRMLTAVFADLDLSTGDLTWINAGHPPPLLIRGQHVVAGALERHAELPLGLGPDYARPPSTVHHAQLEPGDRILIHTDGVTDARSAGGERFGEDRLIDFVVRATAAGERAPEALRRLIHAILDHPSGHLRDDATILLAEWHPASAGPATG